MFRFNFPRICQAIHKEVKHFAIHSQENKSVKLNKLMLRKELFFVVCFLKRCAQQAI